MKTQTLAKQAFLKHLDFYMTKARDSKEKESVYEYQAKINAVIFFAEEMEVITLQFSAQVFDKTQKEISNIITKLIQEQN